VKFSDGPITSIKCFDSTHKTSVSRYNTTPLHAHQQQTATAQHAE